MAFAPIEIGRRIRAVREQVGRSVAELATACGVDERTIEELEAGTLDPVPGDYVLIAARLFHADFRYFISDALDDVEDETRQLFRALKDPRPVDLRAIRRFMLFCMAESDLEQLLEMPQRILPPRYPLPGPTDWRHREQGKLAARQERDRLLLGNKPIANIFQLIRDQGVHLSRHSLEDSNLSGVTVAHPAAGVCVLVNHFEDLYRQFFSAAHEYAHVLFDREQIEESGCIVSYKFSKNELTEMRANAFAAEFLLPSTVFETLEIPKSIKDLPSLIESTARKYYVNTETVAIRMKELGWITERTLESFRRVRPVVVPRKDKTDPDIPAELSETQRARWTVAAEHGISENFLSLLRRGLTEDVISFGRFAEMLDMTIENARDFIRDTGMSI